jgi:predicted permease
VSFLLRLLVALHPAPFRRRFGAEVLGQARGDVARAFEAGTGAGVRCWVATVIDLAGSALAERLHPSWPGPGGNPGIDEGVGMMMRTWMRDLRRAARTLRRSPGFTAAAVLTLGLALGANAGIFSVVDAVLLRPLPYPDADRLVYIAASAPGSDFPDEFGVSAEFFDHYRAEATQLEDLAVFNGFTSTFRDGDRVERLPLAAPSMSFFTTLGVEPELGRWPQPGEGGQVAVLGYGTWTTWFGNDPGIVGRSVWMIDGPRTIVGVMPESFRFPQAGVAAYAPNDFDGEVTNVGRFGMNLVGRLAPGADEASLRAELTELARRLPELYGGSPAYARLIEQHVPVVRPVSEVLLGPVRTAIWVLMAAVSVVLLIACANVANLFMVRAEGRGRDIAVRRALGAGRGRVMRELLAEAWVVAALAAGLAVLLAAVGLPIYLDAVPDGVPRIMDVALSGTTLAFTALAAVAAALVCGLWPAVRGSRTDLGRLRDGTRGSTRSRSWGRDALVAAQTALALVLLVGSGLLLRSVQALRAVDPGYDTTGVLTFQFAPDQEHLVDGPTWAAFHLDFMDRLRALPGVERVGIVENVPLDETPRNVSFVAEGSGVAADDGVRADITFAGGDYFAAMGVDVLRGRAFTDDDARTPGSVIVSRSLAEALWPGEDPVGRRLQNVLLEDWHEVVGVVDDVVQGALRDAPAITAYYPLVGPTPRSWALSSPGYVVRSERGTALVPEIRALITEVAPEAPMYRVHSVEELTERSLVQLNFTMLTLAVAAILALVLGAVGLYGVLSYVVAQRTREIGVRMALGAEAGAVRRMVVAQGVKVVVVGILLGLAGAFAATRGLATLLYGVGAVDPVTFGGVALVMVCVGVVASWVPARRASRVDPIRSMQAG